jgi:hypothetical protein
MILHTTVLGSGDVILFLHTGIMPIKPVNWNQINEEEVQQQQALLNNINAISYFNSLHDESSWRSLLNITKNNGWYPFHVTGDISNITSPIVRNLIYRFLI